MDDWVMDLADFSRVPVRTEDQRPSTWDILKKLFAPLANITPEMEEEFDRVEQDREYEEMLRNPEYEKNSPNSIHDFRGRRYPTLDAYINRNRK